MAALESVLPDAAQTGEPKPVQMARLEAWSPRGFVLDYSAVFTTSGFIFQSDTTYVVTNAANLSGTTVIEGGTVVKFQTNANRLITISGTVDCRTGPYRPAIFTSVNDNTVGETISGSTGNPDNNHGYGVVITSSGNSLHDLRFSYLLSALDFSIIFGPGELNLANIQFNQCRYPLGASQWSCFLTCGATVNLDNALAYGCDAFFQGEYGILRANHLTVNQCNTLGSDSGNDSKLYLTNSLLVAVTNWGNIPYSTTTNKVAYYATDPGGIFQTVGAGAHYLVASSTNRNVGTTNISATLLTNLPSLTTYPPVVYRNQAISNNLVLYPQVQRDSDTPDLGYHYDPLDYAFGAVWVTNATITVNPGTAMGVFSSGNGYGLGLLSGSKFISTGTPTQPNWIVRYHLVQEQADLSWTNNYWDYTIAGNWLGGPTPPEVNCRFTKWSAAADANWQYGDKTQAMPVWFTDCEFHGGRFKLAISSATLTNCLFNRANTTLADDNYQIPSLTLRNCLFYRGVLGILHWEAGTWAFRDNLFDQTAIYQDGDVVGAYNGYTTGTTRLTPTDVNDVVAGLTWQAGPLGRFYQPTNSAFVQVGSLNDAGQVGLFHFTVTTNLFSGWQRKETNSIVDMGYHYVAVDSNGDPVDSDNGGVPDYMEDDSGDGGEVDTGETDPGNPNDDFNYQLIPGYLRCEYRVDPWGVDAKDPWTQQQRPRLYWIVPSPRRAEKQTAYQILVATDTNLLNADTADMWNSGKIYSDRTIHVEYDPVQGKTLQSGQRLWWKVRSWDLHSGLSKWSTNAFFQMGLLDPENDWNGAKWIRVNGYQSANPCPMFRSPVFVLTNQIKNATAYVSAKGVYEFWVNGQKIGPNILAPEWTDYNQRIQYQTFDLTTNLFSGTDTSSNVVGAFVGEGWWKAGNGGWYGTPNPQFLLRLVITNANSTNRIVIDTGTDWSCSTNGPIRWAGIFKGETYEATREGASPDWTLASYTPQYFTVSITNASVVATPMFAQPNDPIQVVQLLPAKSNWVVSSTSTEVVTVFDLGQNMVGWSELALTNVAGLTNTSIFVQHGEALILDSNNRGAFGPNNKTNVYLGNLGDAWPQQETYVLNGDANQQFHPHFTYHGFRYVQVSAPPSIATNLSLASVTGCVIRSAVPVTGNFWCSDMRSCVFGDNLVSRLMTNSFWGLQGNLQGVFTACTQRHEREGYLFDEHVISQTACYFADMGAFFTKWIRDIREAQAAPTIRNDGGYTMYAPWDGLGLVHSTDTDPGCQIGGIIFPWRMYQNYGDRRMLVEHYESASWWFEFLASKGMNPNGTWKATAWGYAPKQPIAVCDWMEGDHFKIRGNGPTDWAVVEPGASATWETWGTAWSAHSADILAGLSDALKMEALSSRMLKNV